MDEWLVIEFIELVSAIFYLVAFAGDYEDDLTRKWFFLIIIVLSYDVFVLHRHRPAWLAVPMNVPTFIYCYEKLWRKSAVFWGKKLATLMLLLVR